MTTAVIDISKRIPEKKPEQESRIAQAEKIKLMAVKLVLRAYEVMGLEEVDRGYWWLHNTLNSAIQGFFEHNIGEMNVPVKTKTEAQERIRRDKERLQRSMAVTVNEPKLDKEARALIIRINQEDDEPQKRKGRQNGQRKGKN